MSGQDKAATPVLSGAPEMLWMIVWPDGTVRTPLTPFGSFEAAEKYRLQRLLSDAVVLRYRLDGSGDTS